MKEIRRHARKGQAAATREARTADNITFHSGEEKEHYLKLKALQQAGKIKQLKLQPKFRFEIDGDDYGSYTADFSYVDETGELVVEDVKAWERDRKGELVPLVDPAFKFQIALMRLQFGIRVRIV